MKNLIIKRSEWFRGLGTENSSLLNVDGKKCCLGFLALNSNIKENDILNKKTPADSVPSVASNFPKQLLKKCTKISNSDFCFLLMEINDMKSLSDTEREFLLIFEFKKMDYNLSFED